MGMICSRRGCSNSAAYRALYDSYYASYRYYLCAACLEKIEQEAKALAPGAGRRLAQELANDFVQGYSSHVKSMSTEELHGCLELEQIKED
jgi:hypothetical protein